MAAELPPKQEQVLEVVLNPKHRKVYDTHLQRERQKVLGLVDDLQQQPVHDLPVADPAAAAGARRRRWSTTAYAGVRSSKIDALVEHLQEVVAEGHRALVFSQFTGFLGTVARPAGRGGPRLRLPRRAHAGPGAADRRVPRRAALRCS